MDSHHCNNNETTTLPLILDNIELEFFRDVTSQGLRLLKNSDDFVGWFCGIVLPEGPKVLYVF